MGKESYICSKSILVVFLQTACIRSAIARLRHEQAKGEIPQFKFIPLNGMEMRHPIECYGRFWEGIYVNPLALPEAFKILPKPNGRLFDFAIECKVARIENNKSNPAR